MINESCKDQSDRLKLVYTIPLSDSGKLPQAGRTAFQLSHARYSCRIPGHNSNLHNPSLFNHQHLDNL
jgi:hypothetical protein